VTIRLFHLNDPPDAPLRTQETTLLANATFPESGNFCFNTSSLNTGSLTAGTIGTLYVQAVGDGANVSSCAGASLCLLCFSWMPLLTGSP
jgi:hypothetical protein